MKSLVLFLFALCGIFLMGCGHFHGTDQSVWSEGTWILPLIFFVGGCIFLWVNFKAAHSGSKINPIYGGGEGGNVPFWKCGWPFFWIFCYVIMIAIIILQNSEK